MGNIFKRKTPNKSNGREIPAVNLIMFYYQQSVILYS